MPASKSISLAVRLRRVKLFLTDVDGVMTDGTVIMGPGIELKQYDIQDGLGIIMLRHNGIKTGWISARKSPATEVRAADLKIDFLMQTKHGKVEAVEQILAQCGLSWADACFVGDDVIDIAVFRKVGLAVAVANARPVAKAEAHLVTKASGGHGAVREIIEKILSAQGKWKSTVEAFAR